MFHAIGPATCVNWKKLRGAPVFALGFRADLLGDEDGMSNSPEEIGQTMLWAETDTHRLDAMETVTTIVKVLKETKGRTRPLLPAILGIGKRPRSNRKLKQYGSEVLF